MPPTNLRRTRPPGCFIFLSISFSLCDATGANLPPASLPWSTIQFLCISQTTLKNLSRISKRKIKTKKGKFEKDKKTGQENKWQNLFQEEYLEENRFDLLGRLYRLSAQHKKKMMTTREYVHQSFLFVTCFFCLSVCVFRSGDSVDASCVISFVFLSLGGGKK
jgi:hypothetical protein